MNADHDRALRDFPVACIIFILSQILDVCTFGNLTLVKARKFTALTRSTSGFHKNFKMVRKEKFTRSFTFSTQGTQKPEALGGGGWEALIYLSIWFWLRLDKKVSTCTCKLHSTLLDL